MLFQRILTVVIAAPFLIGSVLYSGTWAFKAVVFACLLAGLREFYSIVGLPPRELRFSVTAGLVHVFFLIFCPLSLTLVPSETAFVVVAILGGYCFLHDRDLHGTIQRVALSIFGIVYVGSLGAFVGLLRDLPEGRFWVFALFGSTWLNDTFAYFIGCRWGRHRLAPLISPGKTVEGFLGGYLGSAVGLLLFQVLFGVPLTIPQWVVMVLLVGTIGPLGDLSESLIKRSFGVKDSGNVIPGHGGMLDRIDALLFNAPVVYLLAKVFS